MHAKAIMTKPSKPAIPVRSLIRTSPTRVHRRLRDQNAAIGALRARALGGNAPRAARRLPAWGASQLPSIDGASVFSDPSGMGRCGPTAGDRSTAPRAVRDGGYAHEESAHVGRTGVEAAPQAVVRCAPARSPGLRPLSSGPDGRG